MKIVKKLIIIIILIFTILASICIYLLIKDIYYLKENKESTQELINQTIQVNRKEHKKIIDWEYLKNINEDIIAWIEIDGTNINYPILKDTELYYLKHTFEKKYNNNGSIFTTNVFPFIDDETIVYGHNMKNGSMFSNLSKYMNKDFLDSHIKFKIYTPTTNYEAKIFSVYSIDIENEEKNIKSLDFEQTIEYYKKSSKYQIKTDEQINKILKLSTCSYINAKLKPTEQRYYIIANLLII